MASLERVARRIAEVIAGSTVPEDPEHSRNTLEWLLRLDPKADAALRIAALGHDIDRAVEERKVRRRPSRTMTASRRPTRATAPPS